MTVTVITGASSGMGQACVERLRGTADTLVAVDVHKPEIEGVIGVTCDISDPAAVASLAEQVKGLGTLRSLVHAAGISPTMGDARRILEINLLGTVLLLDAFEPLVEPGSAAVCFSSSAAYQVELGGIDPADQAFISDPRVEGFLEAAADRFSDPGMAYSWSKRGVIAACAKGSVSWGKRGGRTNSLAPGLIDTPMGRQEMAEQPIMKTMLEMTPLGRLGSSEDIAGVVAFLLSDDASFISGIDLLVDGGGLQGFKAGFGL
jgi:NAD(P)-dependent dehydrogenase (short-subunit alcohol dehydrogenase family)